MEAAPGAMGVRVGSRVTVYLPDGTPYRATVSAATGTWVPFIPLAPAAGLVAAVAVLTGAAVMVPFYLMSRREPALAPGLELERDGVRVSCRGI